GSMAVVATWNVENLFRPGAGAGPSNTDAYEERLASLADTITAIAPGILALQEIGDPSALDDLIARLTGTWHSALADPDGRGIRVAVIARAPLMTVAQIRDFPDLVRPIQVDDNGTTI